MDTLFEKALNFDSTDILFNNEEGEKFWKESVTEVEKDYDPASADVIRFSIYWAICMQEMIATQKNVNDAANLTYSKACDEAINGGISGATYIGAIWLLSKTWKYGEKLLKWHNERHAHPKTDAIVNPTCLEVSK